MMGEDVELLPCPFCGGSQVGTDQTGPAEYDVTCFSCYAGTIACGPGAANREGAITAWNTRLAQTPPEDVREADIREAFIAGSLSRNSDVDSWSEQSNEEADIAFKRWRALTDASRQVVVPEGWKLVPVEPTQDMIIAAGDCDVTCENMDDEFRGTYRAMLAVAPQPPVSSGEG